MRSRPPQGEPGYPGYDGLPGVIGYPGNEGHQGLPGEKVTTSKHFHINDMRNYCCWYFTDGGVPQGSIVGLLFILKTI